MNQNVLLLRFDIHNLRQRNEIRLPVVGDGQTFFGFCKVHRRFIENGMQFFRQYRLHEIMECGNFVTFCYEIRKPGDEDDLNRIVGLTDGFGKVYTVHAAHFDVEKEDITVFIFCIIKQKTFGRLKSIDRTGYGSPVRPGRNQCGKVFDLLLFIITDCYSQVHFTTCTFSYAIRFSMVIIPQKILVVKSRVPGLFL